MTDDIEIARSLLRAGMPLFVAYPDETSKSGYKLPKRWQHTECDESVLDLWVPGQALCAVTGLVLDVLDIDVQNGGNLALGSSVRSLGKVHTPSGGTHDYIRTLSVRKQPLLPGVDLQSGEHTGRGRGFVFLPPTVRISKTTRLPMPYVWSVPPHLGDIGPKDTWILDVIRATKPERVIPERRERTSDPQLLRYAQKGLANLIRDYVDAEAGTGELRAVAGIRRSLEMVNAGWLDYESVSEAWETAREARESGHPSGGGQDPHDWERIWYYQVDHVGDTPANPPEVREVPVSASARLLRGMPVSTPSTLPSSDVEEAEDFKERFKITWASEIEAVAMEWLWRGKIPLGKLSLIAGKQKIGKSTVALDLVASVTRGTMKDSDFTGVPKNCLIFATEDDWADTIVPRLMAAKADLSRVGRVDPIILDDPHLRLPNDIKEFRFKCLANDIGLVLLDPIMSMISGKIDTHNDQQVRQALDPIVRVAAEARAAVLAVIHVVKSKLADPVDSIMGSTAFVAVARSVLYAQVQRETGERFLSLIAGNGLNTSQTLQYRLDNWSALDSGGRRMDAARVEWVGESELSAWDIMAANNAEPKPEKRATRIEAQRFLLGCLAGGERPLEEIIAEADVLGISQSTLHRASKEIGVVSRKSTTFPRKSYWSGPDSTVKSPGARAADSTGE